MSKKIFIDPGHGNYDSGALGKNGTKEKDINLIVALKVANYLRSVGFEVGMSRNSDVISWPSNLKQDLGKRMQIANSYNADAFISIHCNSCNNSIAKGFEIFTTPGQNNSDIFATKIHSRVKSTFPDLVYREDLSDGDVDKEAKFYVIKYSKCIATLVEMLFISNPEEEKLLNNPDFQDKMAFAIAQGIGDYFGIKVEKIKDKDKENNNKKEEINKDMAILNTKNKANVKVNDKDVFVENYNIDGHIYMQVKDLANMFGKTVEWDDKTKTISIK